MAFILEWRPARWTGTTRESGGRWRGWHGWQDWADADEWKHNGGRRERADERHAEGAAGVSTARRRHLQGPPDSRLD